MQPGRSGAFDNRIVSFVKELLMARGDKSAYTDNQKREAEHIESGYEHRGRSREEAERIAWSTVNKESGGGKLSGSGRANHDDPGSELVGAVRTREERSEAAKRGWATRRSKDAYA